VNRYWTLTNGGLGFDQYSSTFNFLSSDLDPSADPATFAVGRYSSSTWSIPHDRHPHLDEHAGDGPHGIR